MEISKPNEGYIDTDKIKADLNVFLAAPLPSESPPCPSCEQHIRSDCNSKCANASSSLSIDPDKYPIETNITPLVFEITATCVMQTCWSCEGHLDENNNLWKLPNVSFYAKSSIYPQLLVKHIKNLNLNKQLKYPWQVILADYAQTLGTTYTIQPDLCREEEIHLGLLQHDIKTIADDMLEKLKVIARQCLHDLK